MVKIKIVRGWFRVVVVQIREKTPPQSAPQARSVGGKIRHVIKGFTCKQNGAFFQAKAAHFCAENVL